MHRTITLPEDLVLELEEQARKKGLTLEGYLRRWQRRRTQRERLHDAVRRIKGLKERLSAKYGMMEDSVPLIREDRER